MEQAIFIVLILFAGGNRVRITDLSYTTSNGRQRLTAMIHWDNVSRSPQNIYFETTSDSPRLYQSIAPFIISAAVPAMAAGETTIETDYPLDPALFEGIPTALNIIFYWCRDIASGWAIPQLKAPIAGDIISNTSRGTAFFYSGGVDATFTLLQNHSAVPLNDPGRIVAALIVYGLDLGFKTESDDHAAFLEFVTSASSFLKPRLVQPIVMWTNVRQLDPRPGFWGRAFNGFPLSAIAQLFPERFHQVLIGTSGDRLSDAVQQPWGSHPVIHSYLNSINVQGRSPCVEITRLNRTKRIARDPEALKSLRVCFHSSEGRLNCGHCEKCVRTRVALLLAGMPTEVFPGPPLDAELIRSIVITSKVGQLEHEELRDGLRDAGLRDLADAEDRILYKWKKHRRWLEGKTIGGRIRRLLG